MADTFSATTLGTQLLSAATDSIAYIGVGVAGGVVVLAAVWGLKLGLKALKTVGK